MVGVVWDHRVEVAEQQQPALAVAPQMGEQVLRVPRRGAFEPLDLDLVGEQRGGDSDGRLGRLAVTGGR